MFQQIIMSSSMYLSEKNMKLIMESIVLGQIYYGSEIYLQHFRTKAHKVVNSAARLVLIHYRFANCETMMQDLSWLNMNNHHRYQFLTSLRYILQTRASALTFSMLDWNTKLSNSLFDSSAPPYLTVKTEWLIIPALVLILMFTGHINFYHHAIYTLYSMSMIYPFWFQIHS